MKGSDAVTLVFLILGFKPAFSLSSFTLIKRLFTSSLLSAIRVVSSVVDISESDVTQSCPTLRDPMYSLPGFSVRGILQARILDWVAISFSRRSSQPRD